MAFAVAGLPMDGNYLRVSMCVFVTAVPPFTVPMLHTVFDDL
jgi:hypothetical protein